MKILDIKRKVITVNMFNGTIIRAPNHFRSMGKSYRKEEIPWLPWGTTRPQWQYSCNKKYVGTMGGWIMNRISTDNWFYLSEQPNDAAFEMMDNYL